VDVSLLEENLRLTPTERLEQLQRMTELYEALRPDDLPAPRVSQVSTRRLPAHLGQQKTSTLTS